MNYLSWILIATSVISIYCAEKKLLSTKTSIYLVRTMIQDNHHILQPVYPIIVKEKILHEEYKIKIK